MEGFSENEIKKEKGARNKIYDYFTGKEIKLEDIDNIQIGQKIVEKDKDIDFYMHSDGR